MQLPIGEESAFKGVVDLLTETAIIWEDESGSDPVVTQVPEDLKKVARKRAELVEKIAELDDDLIVKFLEDQEITIAELKKA